MVMISSSFLGSRITYIKWSQTPSGPICFLPFPCSPFSILLVVFAFISLNCSTFFLLAIFSLMLKRQNEYKQLPFTAYYFGFFQCKVKTKICIMQYSTRSIEWYYFHVHAYDFSTYFVMFQFKFRKTDMIGEYSFDLLLINEFYSVFSFQRYQDHSLILPPSAPVIFSRAMVRSFSHVRCRLRSKQFFPSASSVIVESDAEK